MYSPSSKPSCWNKVDNLREESDVNSWWIDSSLASNHRLYSRNFPGPPPPPFAPHEVCLHLAGEWTSPASWRISRATGPVVRDARISKQVCRYIDLKLVVNKMVVFEQTHNFIGVSSSVGGKVGRHWSNFAICKQKLFRAFIETTKPHVNHRLMNSKGRVSLVCASTLYKLFLRLYKGLQNKKTPFSISCDDFLCAT